MEPWKSVLTHASWLEPTPLMRIAALVHDLPLAKRSQQQREQQWKRLIPYEDGVGTVIARDSEDLWNRPWVEEIYCE